jgi:hypothetical protein
MSSRSTPCYCPPSMRRVRFAKRKFLSFDLKYSCGTLPHAALMKSIELYGTEVVPRVRHGVVRIR